MGISTDKSRPRSGPIFGEGEHTAISGDRVVFARLPCYPGGWGSAPARRVVIGGASGRSHSSPGQLSECVLYEAIMYLAGRYAVCRASLSRHYRQIRG